MRTALFLLSFVIMVNPQIAFSQSDLRGNVHLGILRLSERQQSNILIGGRLLYQIHSRWSIEGGLDWVNLEVMTGPASRSDYDALLYTSMVIARFDPDETTELLLGTGLGGITFLLHDVTSTTEKTDTKLLIPLAGGIRWSPQSLDPTSIRVEVRDDIIFGTTDGVVDESMTRSHNLEISLGLDFSL